LGVSPKAKGEVVIEQRIDAPPVKVAAYIGDFKNAKEWMVGVDSVQKTGDDSYRLTLESPVGKIEPEAKIVEHSPTSIRWVYTSTIEGGGRVDVAPKEDDACLVTYAGEFSFRSGLLDRAARMVGIERFARRNGERSLARLKHLMEARRF
jgi:carbon monoxide dehydrogenase subunit G